jgi:hypothetical protein
MGKGGEQENRKMGGGVGHSSMKVLYIYNRKIENYLGDNKT